ncbi:hypothetical protein EI94DRAFT_1787083 [Lactarius quietus]|nr:hypothetical protein EI94DRAFT_1787083 [Lactarius quietus]
MPARPRIRVVCVSAYSGPFREREKRKDRQVADAESTEGATGYGRRAGGGGGVGCFKFGLGSRLAEGSPTRRPLAGRGEMFGGGVVAHHLEGLKVRRAMSPSLVKAGAHFGQEVPPPRVGRRSDGLGGDWRLATGFEAVQEPGEAAEQLRTDLDSRSPRGSLQAQVVSMLASLGLFALEMNVSCFQGNLLMPPHWIRFDQSWGQQRWPNGRSFQNVP